MNYRKEFRYFDFDIPALPQGFIDTSWHNDVSPKFERKYNKTHSVVFWVDYLDESRRECGGKQFTVVIQSTEDDCISSYVEPEYIIETDSWDEAVNAINQLFNKASMKPYTQNEINDLAESALDVACAFIQEQLNVSTGDLAGLFFTGKAKEVILEVLQDYISQEIQFKD